MFKRSGRSKVTYLHFPKLARAHFSLFPLKSINQSNKQNPKNQPNKKHKNKQTKTTQKNQPTKQPTKKKPNQPTNRNSVKSFANKWKNTKNIA